MIIALFGKPSSGKSTFFRASTLADAEIAEYPFTTLKAFEAVAYVRVKCACEDFNVECKPKHGFCKNGTRFVPIKLMDIPGLIEGSHKGLGMGNQFLDNVREADALIHIIDTSGKTNEKGELTEDYDPCRDVKMLEAEIDLWYLSILKKNWEKFSRQVKQEKLNLIKAIAKQLSGLKVNEKDVEEAIKKLKLNDDISRWKNEDIYNLAIELRERTKPMVIAANKIDVNGSEKNLENLKEHFVLYKIIPCSGEAEYVLKTASSKGLIDYIPGGNKFTLKKPDVLTGEQMNGLNFIKENVLGKYGSTGVQQVLEEATFNILKLIAVFPVANSKLQDKDGNLLPDCFLVKEGTTALDLAFKLHSDIGNNFVKAMDLRTKKAVGKEHLLKDGAVIEVMTRK